MHKRVKHVSDAARHQRLNGVVGHSVSTLVVLSPVACALTVNSKVRGRCVMPVASCMPNLYVTLDLHMSLHTLTSVFFSNSVVKKEGTRRGTFSHRR